LQELCKAKLNVAYEHSKPEARKMAVLGHGNGFSFEASPYCSYATCEGVHVVLAGEVSDWPGISAVAAAHDGEWTPVFRTAITTKCSRQFAIMCRRSCAVWGWDL
jgi:hypothetical protein